MISVRWGLPKLRHCDRHRLGADRAQIAIGSATACFRLGTVGEAVARVQSFVIAPFCCRNADHRASPPGRWILLAPTVGSYSPHPAARGDGGRGHQLEPVRGNVGTLGTSVSGSAWRGFVIGARKGLVGQRIERMSATSRVPFEHHPAGIRDLADHCKSNSHFRKIPRPRPRGPCFRTISIRSCDYESIIS